MLGAAIERQAEVLTPLALQLLASLHRRFNTRRLELLNARRDRQIQLDDGALPDFLADTAKVRAGEWRIEPVPQDLLDRRVEITGPVDRKMVINALNAPVRCFMADFEDSCSPTWENLIRGQVNLADAIRRTISFADGATGKIYRLNEHTATLIVRPRGWHLPEKHVRIDGEPVSGALFDFALFLANNHEALARRGTGPYFYLPKMESHLEARLWNEVFIAAQEALGLPRGTIKATVLIETMLAAFEMDEILFELREHSAGLNCGRWDYIFSFIKKFRNRADFVLPDRGTVTMDRHFLKSYVELLIKTCHRRGAHAMGGMAAQIPIRDDPKANEAAMARVRADKLREAHAGHDGTWIAHPGLAAIAREAFDAVMHGPNQLAVSRAEVNVGRARPAEGARGRHHRGRGTQLHPRGRAVPRGLAARQRLRAALPSDGGCRHGRDLPRAAVAVAQARGAHQRRAADHARALRPADELRDRPHPRRGRTLRASPTGYSPPPRACSSR